MFVFVRWEVPPITTSSWPTPAPVGLLAWLLEVWAPGLDLTGVLPPWVPCMDLQVDLRGSHSTQTMALDPNRAT